MPTFRFASRLLVLLALALLAACATGPTIHTETSHSVDMGSYRSFAFLSPLATDHGGSESKLSKRLKAATVRNLEAKGYVYSETDPDLLVNFYANIAVKMDVYSSPTAPLGPGYYAYRQGYYDGLGTEIETRNYREGTLTIDLVDADRKAVAWQGQIEGEVNPEVSKSPGQRVDDVVEAIIAKLPARQHGTER